MFTFYSHFPVALKTQPSIWSFYSYVVNEVFAEEKQTVTWLLCRNRSRSCERIRVWLGVGETSGQPHSHAFCLAALSSGFLLINMETRFGFADMQTVITECELEA